MSRRAETYYCIRQRQTCLFIMQQGRSFPTRQDTWNQWGRCQADRACMYVSPIMMPKRRENTFTWKQEKQLKSLHVWAAVWYVHLSLQTMKHSLLHTFTSSYIPTRKHCEYSLLHITSSRTTKQRPCQVLHVWQQSWASLCKLQQPNVHHAREPSTREWVKARSSTQIVC